MDGESSLLHVQTYGLILKYPRMKCLNRVEHRTIKPEAPVVGDLKEVSLVVGCVEIGRWCNTFRSISW